MKPSVTPSQGRRRDHPPRRSCRPAWTTALCTRMSQLRSRLLGSRLLVNVTGREDMKARERPREPRRWRPTSYEQALDDMTQRAQHLDWTQMSWLQIHQTIAEHQDRWHDRKTARQRREERVPTQARFCYRTAAASTNAEEAKYYKNAAWNIIKQYHKDKNDRVRAQVTWRSCSPEGEDIEARCGVAEVGLMHPARRHAAAAALRRHVDPAADDKTTTRQSYGRQEGKATPST